MKLFSISIVVICCIVATTHACTEFVVPCLDKSIIIGRTLMFDYRFEYHIITEPKGKEHRGWRFPHGSSCFGKTPRSWYSKSANIFISPQEHFSPRAPVDGQNADGLSVAALYFEGYAKYPKAHDIPKEKCHNAIPHLQVGEFIQTQYSKTQEVRDAINNNEFPFVWGVISHLPYIDIEFIFPFHWSIIDKTGDAMVLEYTKEGRIIHNNTIGVFTNSPTYDWHMTNLKNYVNLQNSAPPVRAYEYVSGRGVGIIEGFGIPSGGHGIPGDFTSTSRFVRTTVLVQFSEKPANAKRGVIKAWHILNGLGFPNGAGDGSIWWVVVKDLNNNVIYFRDIDYISIRKVDLNKASKTTTKFIKISDDFMKGVKDVTYKMETSNGEF